MALLKVSPGDIVGVPAAKDGVWGFVLSRVIREDKVLWIEVFSSFLTNFSISETGVLAQDLSGDNRLFNPIYASFDFNRHFGKIKWPILARAPAYTPGQSKISQIEFEGISYFETGLYLKGGKEYREPPGVRRNLEDRTTYSNPQLVHRINLHLSGYVRKGEPWNARLERPLIEREGMYWWSEGEESCKIAADEVASRFLEARKKVERRRS
jgi:hypothetical protein